MSGVQSTAYAIKSKVISTGRNAVKYSQNTGSLQLYNAKGFEEYSSPTMIYSKTECNGTLQKKINDAKFYHSTNYHNKFFELNFKS